MSEMLQVMEQLKPAYLELHGFIRQELSKKYNYEISDLNRPIPDHLFQQVLSQAWKENSIIEAYFPFNELPRYDVLLENFSSKQIFNYAQDFYKSLGFADLDEDFCRNRLKSQNPPDGGAVCHANIFDLTPRVRMQYCEEVDFKKFMQMHGYLGRIHYAREREHLPAYFFEAYGLQLPVGEAVILSASSPRHLQNIGLAKNTALSEQILMNRLFRMAVHTILNIPQFYIHSRIMSDLLRGHVKMDGVNQLYWKLMQDYAGVEPPVERAEGSLDFPHKFYLDLESNHQAK